MRKLLKFLKSIFYKVKVRMFGVKIKTNDGRTIVTNEITGLMAIDSSHVLQPKNHLIVPGVTQTSNDVQVLCSQIGYVGRGDARTGVVTKIDSRGLNIYNFSPTPVTLSIVRNKVSNQGKEYGINFGDGFSTVSEGFSCQRLIYSGKGSIEQISERLVNGSRYLTTVIRVSVVSEAPPVIFGMIYNGNGIDDEYRVTPFSTISEGSYHDFYFLIKERIDGFAGGHSEYVAFDPNSKKYQFYVYSSDSASSRSEYGMEVYDDSGKVVYSGDYHITNICGNSVISPPSYMKASSNPINARSTITPSTKLAVAVTGAIYYVHVSGGGSYALLYAPMIWYSGGNIMYGGYTIDEIGQPYIAELIGFAYYDAYMRDIGASGYRNPSPHAVVIDVTNTPESFGNNMSRLCSTTPRRLL